MARQSSTLLPLALVLSTFVAGACSTFGSDPEQPGGVTPDADASTSPDGSPGVTGTPDRGLTVTVGDPKATAFVMQNGTLDLPVKLTRRPSTTGDVVVTVTNLPADVTAEPVTIPKGKTEGTLTLKAKATSVQGGPKIADVTALEQGALGSGASGKVSTFVRGGRGALDTTFGDKGSNIQVYGPGSEGNIYDARLLKDGSMFVGGRARGSFLLSRYSGNGLIDPAFSGGGTVTVIGSIDTIAFDVLESPSAGMGFICGLNGVASSPQIVRLNLDGTRDTGFNATGQVTLDDGTGSAALLMPLQIAALPDGKMLVLSRRNGGPSNVTRWNPDGTRDDTYGTAGSCQFNGGARMIVRSGGGVFVISTSGMQGCTTTGQHDTTIGIAPDYSAKLGGATAVDIANGPSGSVVFLEVRGSNPPQAFWNRLTSSLVKDASIGTLGDVFAVASASPAFVVDSEGGVMTAVALDDAFKITRFTSKGVVDKTFGANGTASFTIAGGAVLTRLVAQPDGRILALGKSDQTGFDAAMVRFWP